jgi:hypothetical protein
MSPRFRAVRLHEFEAVYATIFGVRKYEVYFVIGPAEPPATARETGHVSFNGTGNVR